MKYIVYCTINTSNNKIYIGVHQTKNPEIFDGYIGNGCYIHKSNTYEHPKTKFQYAVKKYGPKSFIRHTLCIFDTAEEAYFLEELIVTKKFLERNDVYNMVVGGVSRTLDSMCIKTYCYDLEGNFVKEYPSINQASKEMDISMKSIWRALNDKIKCKEHFWSKEKYDKLDLTYYKTENVDRSTTVYQYSETGEYECCYDSISIASKLLNVNKSVLSKSIALGIKCLNKYFTNTFAPEFHRAKVEKLKNTEVHQYDLYGNYVKSWPSALNAQKTLGIKSDLHKAIKLGNTAGNYQWSHEKLDKMSPLLPKGGRKRKIGKYDKNGNLIKTYESLAKCKQENGSGVHHVLSGRDQFHKGFKYEYLQ